MLGFEALSKRSRVARRLASNAPAGLVGLSRLWGLRWPAARLAELAMTLGTDVPFFLRGGAALGTGRGERIEPVASTALALVLVNPGVGASTLAIYGGVTPAMYSDGSHVRQMVAALRSRDPARVGASLFNALERVAATAYRQVAQMEAALLAAGALGAAMSGSGLTVVGVARSFDHPRHVRARVSRGAWACWAVRAIRGPAIRMTRDP